VRTTVRSLSRAQAVHQILTDVGMTRDVATAHVLAMTADDVAGERFLLASDPAMSMKALGGVLRDRLGVAVKVGGEDLPRADDVEFLGSVEGQHPTARSPRRLPRRTTIGTTRYSGTSASRGASGSQNRDHIGLGEIVTLEEKRNAGEPGHGVGETVTEVETCRVVALAELAPAVDGG